MLEKYIKDVSKWLDNQMRNNDKYIIPKIIKYLIGKCSICQKMFRTDHLEDRTHTCNDGEKKLMVCGSCISRYFCNQCEQVMVLCEFDEFCNCHLYRTQCDCCDETYCQECYKEAVRFKMCIECDRHCCSECYEKGFLRTCGECNIHLCDVCDEFEGILDVGDDITRCRDCLNRT